MKNTQVLLIVSVTLLSAACSSKKAVNEDPRVILMPGYSASTGAPLQPTDGGSQAIQDAMSTASSAAISGRLQLSGALPVPLPRTQMALYKAHDEKWTEVSRFTTETDGSFQVTQKLTSGKYELRVLDKRYQGSLPVTLEKTPVTRLIFQVTAK